MTQTVSDEEVAKMFAKEIVDGLFHGISDTSLLTEFMRLMEKSFWQLIAEVRRDERERCAQMLEDAMPATQDMEHTFFAEALERVAAAIRSRKD